MRKSLKYLIATSAVVAGLAVAPALYAEDTQGSRMDPGMMGQDGMMGQGGMMGMMSMMGQMGQMMESCNKMMQSYMNDQGTEHPNDQWREDAPVEPDHNG